MTLGHYVWSGTQWVNLDGTTGPVTPPPVGAYTGPIIWGASDPAGGDPAATPFITLRNQCIAAGGTLNGQRVYGQQSGLPLDATSKSRHNTGSMLVKHVRCNVGGTSAWANIAAGAYDDVYDALFLDMLNLTYGNGITAPTQSIFTLDGEMDRLSPDHGTPAQFKAAWAHLYNRLRTTGPNAGHANNAKLLFGFCATGFGMRHTTAGADLNSPGLGGNDRVSPFCPPDNQVDIHAPDVYNNQNNWGTGTPASYKINGSVWHEMGDLFDFVRTWSVNSGHLIGKQILVVEGDCQEFGTLTASWDANPNKGPFPDGNPNTDFTRKANWFRNAVQYMKNNHDAVGWLYWNVNYPENTSTQAHQGFLDASVAAKNS